MASVLVCISVLWKWRRIRKKQKLLRDSNFDDLTLQPSDDAQYTNQFTEFLRANATEEEPEKKKKEPKRRNLKGKLDEFI